MSQRAFITLLILLAVLVALSATPFPGAMIGFLFGIAIAFFVAGPAMLVDKVLENNGIAISGETALWVLAGFYALLILFAAFQIWRRLQRQEPDQARSAGMRLALLVALPAMAWLSVNAMQEAWP
jgi:predicted permease